MNIKKHVGENKNPELKKDFMGDNPTLGTESILNLIFRKLQPFEIKFDKDASAFNKEEILEAISGMETTSYEALRSYVSIIKKYEAYATAKGVEGADHGEWKRLNINDIRGTISQDIIDTKLITRDELDQILDDLINPCDKFLLLAFYEGFKGKRYEDIYKTVPEDFHKDTYTVDLPSGRTISISKELYNIAMESANQYEYMGTKDGFMLSSYRLSPLCKNIYKYRDNTSNPEDEEKARARIAQHMLLLKKITGYSDITIPRIRNSGIIMSIKELAKKTGKSEKEIVSSPEFKVIKNQYGIDAPGAALRNRYFPYLS